MYNMYIYIHIICIIEWFFRKLLFLTFRLKLSFRKPTSEIRAPKKKGDPCGKIYKTRGFHHQKWLQYMVENGM